MARLALPLSVHVMCTPSDRSAAYLAGATPPPPLPNMRQQRLRRRHRTPSLHAKALLDQAAPLPHLLSLSCSLLRSSPPLSFRTATRRRSRNLPPLWLLNRSRPLPPLPPPPGPRSKLPAMHALRVPAWLLRPQADKTLLRKWPDAIYPSWSPSPLHPSFRNP